MTPVGGLAPRPLGGSYGPIGRETTVRGSAASRFTGDRRRARALGAAVRSSVADVDVLTAFRSRFCAVDVLTGMC